MQIQKLFHYFFYLINLANKNYKKQNLESRLGLAQARIKKMRTKQRDFKKLMAQDFEGMDPDEIKVKLNQIYDWNDKKQCLTILMKGDIIIL